MAEPLPGRCACGQVRFVLHQPPFAVHCCHCRDCQRETGSAFVINALIEASRLQLRAGMPETVATPSASGRGQRIVRCPQCRVALWSHYAGMGDKACFVRVGTLEEPDRCPPQVHIFARSKQPWVVLPEGAPAYAVFYDVAEIDTLFGREGAARWRALRAS